MDHTHQKEILRGFAVHPQWRAALENIRVVLVGTTHPGNIGAIARVMKNTGLSRMVLVATVECGPETESLTIAGRAYDIIESADRTATLEEALTGTILACGTSGRLSEKRSFSKTPDESAGELLNVALLGPVAVVFGRESRGLTNEELKLCTHHMVIPTDGAYASLNVSHAAAIIGYELFKNACRPTGVKAMLTQPAQVDVREGMYKHIETTLIESGFFEEGNSLIMMREIRRILNSAQLDDRDARIIRGVFRKMGNAVRFARSGANSTE